MRKAEVFLFERLAGRIVETDDGRCQFAYDVDYMKDPDSEPISPTMPFQEESYWSDEMLPFFDGLIPEGWLLNVAERNWKVRRHDRMGLLLACCRDCIGNVSVEPIPNEEEINR